MKQKITIELFEEHSKVNMYSFTVGDNDDTELELFIKNLENKGKSDDLTVILGLIDKIGENGAQERYFRYEGRKNDHVCALPDHFLVKSKFRLYCLRYGDIILVLGNGGLKTTKTYQKDPHLNSCVKLLQKIDKKINQLLESGAIYIDGKTIRGDLHFYI